ncbi:MAG: flagellar basal body protein FliL [Alkaliphilus sp.]|nr:flagellar basal body-associated FliL family protein [Alkaliphilus transvaalensis]MBN4069858.1 flagellar basal body-associated FliL family protein [bacterium AH-315-G05]PHS35253.1 MAG: flagellar basal body protein FliL [Alkaliphilus sp.]
MSIKKIVLFAIIGLIVVGIIAGTILYFTIFRSTDEEKIVEIETFEFQLGKFTTNLSDSRDFFRGDIVIETSNKDLLKEFETKNAELRDRIIKIIITKKPNEMLSADGLQKLREEIIAAISDVIDTDEITNLFFIDYIIQ